jgi:hypothetical protein
VSFRRNTPSTRRDRRRDSRRSRQSTHDDRSIFIVIGLFALGIAALLILLAVFG